MKHLTNIFALAIALSFALLSCTSPTLWTEEDMTGTAYVESDTHNIPTPSCSNLLSTQLVDMSSPDAGGIWGGVYCTNTPEFFALSIDAFLPIKEFKFWYGDLANVPIQNGLLDYSQFQISEELNQTGAKYSMKIPLSELTECFETVCYLKLYYPDGAGGILFETEVVALGKQIPGSQGMTNTFCASLFNCPQATCEPWIGAENPCIPPVSESGCCDCKGGISELSFIMDQTAAGGSTVAVYNGNKAKAQDLILTEYNVVTGGQINISAANINQTQFAKSLTVVVDGGSPIRLHTSCSQQIVGKSFAASKSSGSSKSGSKSSSGSKKSGSKSGTGSSKSGSKSSKTSGGKSNSDDHSAISITVLAHVDAQGNVCSEGTSPCANAWNSGSSKSGSKSSGTKSSKKSGSSKSGSKSSSKSSKKSGSKSSGSKSSSKSNKQSGSKSSSKSSSKSDG